MDVSALDQIQIELGSGQSGLLTLVLATMMYAVALGLRREHFMFFREDPKHYLAGMLAQIIGLPLLTLGLVMVLKPAPSLALGMILVACCPGGNISNLLAMFGRANTALSVSMTATSSLAAAFVTPVSILFWLSIYEPTRQLLSTTQFDRMAFLSQTLLILALPLLLGALTAWRAPKLAKRLQKPLALFGGVVLLGIIFVGFYTYRAVLADFGMIILPLVIVHNALAFALGYGTGLVTQADIPTRRALAFEVGIQNSGLGLIILLTHLSGLGGAAAITGMWGLWHIVAGGCMVFIFRTVDKKRGTTNAI
ncbi:MAG: bile acid transporter [Robiginitomaculum sp.]|nr:MAG: bile acid transporter [Robiginitomaculum sp.]